MSAVEIKFEIQSYLEQVKDESFLKAVHAMLDTYVKEQADPIVGYETNGTPVTTSTFIEQAEIAVADAKTGKGITVEELENRSTEWLKRIQ